MNGTAQGRVSVVEDQMHLADFESKECVMGADSEANYGTIDAKDLDRS